MSDEANEPPVRDWEGYIRWSSGREVRPLLTRVVSHYGVVAPGARAVDVGCGDGTETRALLDAGYALPFCPPDRFPAFWGRLVAGLRPGGLLACDLFGDRDTWYGTEDMTFVTRDLVHGLVEGLELRSLHEIEEDGQAYGGPKHWHTFQVIARRPVVA